MPILPCAARSTENACPVPFGPRVPAEAVRGERFARAGGGGGGSSSSSGARGGGSSSGSSGSKGSSGPSGSSGSSGSKGPSGSAGGRTTTVQGGRAKGRASQARAAAQLPANQRGGLFEQRGAGSYGYGRPIAGGPALRYGFWPLLWVANVPDGVAPTNDTRPGGPLLAAALQPPNNAANATYVLYADTQSVQAVLPAAQANCAAVNGTAPADLSGNQTLQSYRDDSFALYRFAGPSAETNGSFEACLNATIGDNLLVASGTSLQAPWTLAVLVAVAVGMRLR